MRILIQLLSICIFITNLNSQIIISQYVEAATGTTPKGIEIWNTSGGVIDFSVTPLLIEQQTNANSTWTSLTTINTGTLPTDAVLVVGTSPSMDLPNLTGECSNTIFTGLAFIYNGNDALRLTLNGTVTDIFGDPSTTDPGSPGWVGGGVSTANNNIKLLAGITSGDIDGWTDPSERFEQVAAAPDLTDFGIPPIGCTVVPIVLTSFHGITTFDNCNRLEWKTFSEVNNSHFEIFHSKENLNYKKVGKIQGAGNSNSALDYEFKHKTPDVGVNYYKLVQVDFDGRSEVFGPIVIEFKTKSKKNIEIYPTIASDGINLLNADKTDSYSICNVLGQTLRNGLSAEYIDISTFQSGTYYLLIGNERFMFNKI